LSKNKYFQFTYEKNIGWNMYFFLFIATSFCLFISMLCAKILCRKKAFVRYYCFANFNWLSKNLSVCKRRYGDFYWLISKLSFLSYELLKIMVWQLYCTILFLNIKKNYLRAVFEKTMSFMRINVLYSSPSSILKG